ncbi:hypothetical protein QN277_010623 [Acacia crassicarpa]|uniref:Disease resistance protein At4g27190-like leucine-rich repeats domain-containing protein n=1 Tax=Acacia crassicarpa TaxID=499986 RepID=A0AAE1M503_9FABA|nr:hypothetical protein QN277_010623 [Acacia crassicarpa]
MEIEELNDVELFRGFLPGLHQLCLQNVSFTSIGAHSSPWRMMKFKRLNHLTVWSCNQLKYLLPLYVLKDLQQLKTIDIGDCEQLEHVFVDEQDTQTTKSNVMEVLPLLHSLTLINLPELACICWGDAHFPPRSLTQMTVESCPKFIFTFDNNLKSIKEEEPSKKKSKEMILTPSMLENLNLRRVDHLTNMCEDPKVSFKHLTYLQLENCDTLEYLFPLSTAQKLSCLQELRIISCERIKQIVKRETEETRANTIEFLQLKTLILVQLPKFMGSSGKDGASVRWLALETVRVVQCSNIQKSMLGMVDRPLLKNVTVSNCPPWESTGDVERNIGYLFEAFEVDQYSLVLGTLSDWEEPLQNSVAMEIEEFNDVELFLGFLPGLHQLCLQNVSFTSIGALSSPWRMMKFKLLNHLTVWSCNQLKYLLPLYVLKDLQQLKTIDIGDCEQLEHVFVDEQDTQTTKSNVMEVLPLLHSLTLINLPELACICWGDAHFTPRSLTQMTVESCPKFIFTFDNNLKSIKEEEPSKKKSKEMILTPSILEKLNLRRVDHLTNMCEDPKVSFKHLTYLQLENCDKLEYLFSLSTAQRLSCLQELRIISCERIKQIVKRETEETTRANTIEFLQLKTLILVQLPKFTGSSGMDGAIVRWLALETVRVAQCSNIQKSMLGTVDRPLLKNVTVSNCLPWASGNVQSDIGYLFELTVSTLFLFASQK